LIGDDPVPSVNDDSPEERLAAARSCLQQLCPRAEGARRAAVASDGIRQLVDYRAYLAAVESEPERDCPGLRAQLAERAFAAEGSFRVVLAEGLKSLNDLRDSGMLHAALSEFARTLKGDEQNLSQMFRATREELQRGPLALPGELSDEALGEVERRLIGLGYDSERDALIVRRVGLADGKPEQMHVPLSPRTGEMGRIDLDQFFGAGDPFSIRGEVIIAPPSDCHQRVTIDVETANPRVIDAYAGVLGGMATAREAMYRHARKVSRYGHGTGLRGDDPVTAGITAGVIWGVATLISSAVPAAGPPSSIALAVLAAWLLASAVVLIVLGLVIF
jgi:hypothetical protein